MRFCRWNGWAVVFMILVARSPALATTTEAMSFSEIVDASEIVIEGTVVDLRVTATGTANQTQGAKQHVLPRTPGAPGAGSGAAAPPQPVDVEGGRMLFTWVTMQVTEEIVGQAGAQVAFRVAGGTDGKVRVVVHGMPAFERGKRYIVFLRRGFEQAGDPLVGVNQGYFQVVHDAAEDRDVLLDSHGDVVLAITGDRFVTRVNPARASGAAPRLGAAPVPDPGSGAQSRVSPGAARSRLSTERPMAKEELISKVRSESEKP